MSANIIDLDNLGKRIEDLVWEHDISYIDAVLMLAENLGMEEENIGNIISSNAYIISKIREEAEDLNFIEKGNRLDLKADSL